MKNLKVLPLIKNVRWASKKAAAQPEAPPASLGFFFPKPVLAPKLPNIKRLSPEELDIGNHPNFKRPDFKLLKAIELENRLRYDPDGRTNLFRKGSETEVSVGSVMSVEHIMSRSNPRKQIFSGVLTEIRKRGIGSSFVLESVIMASVVRMRFPIYSPMITKISVLKQ